MKKILLLFVAMVASLTAMAVTTLTEGFETATASTTYNSTQEYTADKSDCGISWTMYYGTVSTNDKIEGENSAQMRYYSSTTNNLPYIMTTTAIENLSKLSFKARVSNTDVKFNVSCSVNGTSWTDIATDVKLDAAGSQGVKSFAYTIPSGYQYIKIGVSPNTTTPSSGNYKFIIDAVEFTTGESEPQDPTVTLRDNITVKVGNTATNEITAPDELTFTYSSEDSSIASVDANGVVTGVAAGTTTITVAWAAVQGLYNAGSKTYTVTVKAADDQNKPVEGFETAPASSTYNQTQTYTTDQSDCGIGWVMYYGCVSTNDKIEDTKSAQMRYYANATSNLPYIMTTTPLEGLSHIAFKARVSDTSIKFNVSYSTNGSSWTDIATDEQLTAAGSSGVSSFEYDIPSGGQYIKISVSGNTTAPSSGNVKLLIDEVEFTIEEVLEHIATVEISTTELIAGVVNGEFETTPEGLVVSYTSDDPNVADIIESSVVGITEGTTTITATWEAQTVDGADYAAGSQTFEVTVTLSQPTISISSTSLNLDDATTATITLDPEDLQVTYASSDENVAVVSDGIVNAVGEGTASIVVSWDEQNVNDIPYGAGSQTFEVTVSAPATPVTYYKVTDNKQLYPGNEYILVAENANVAMGESGTNTFRAAVEVEISSESTITITNEAVAVLTLGGSTGEWTFQPSDSEEVLGLKSDSNRLDNMEDHSLWSITNDFQVVNNDFDRYIQYNSGASRFAAYKNTQATSVLYVKEGYSESDKDFATVEISTTDITAGLNYAEITTTPEDLVVTYSSDNPEVANVSETGEVNGYGEGTANITVTWEEQEVDGVAYYGGSETFTVTVSLSVANVSISSTNLNLDDATTATITLDPEDLQVTYFSSDEGVATVADGIVTAVGEGTATITVSWEAQNANDLSYGAGTQTFEITVSDDRPMQCVFEEEYYTRFDLSVNGWGLPEKSANITQSGSYENSGKTITLEGDPGFYFNTSGFILLGKTGATLTLPAFGFDVMAIEVTGASGASANTKQNIFVGETAVSTETTGAKGTNLYFIDEDYQSAGNIYTIKVNNSYNTQFTEIKVYKKDAFVELSVSDAGYRTYCDADALDFNVASDGLKAYIVEGVDAAGSTNLVLKEVGKVPAETGVLLEAEEGTYYVALASAKTEEESSDFDDVSTNQLIGVTESTEVEPSIIVLMNGENGVGFYKTSKTFTVGAHTAYLPISTLETVADAGADGVKTLNINADSDTPTGINCISAVELSGKDAVIYNLKGQRVSRAVKGIYIVNGKKVMVK